MLRTSALRVLDARDRTEVAELLARDPVAHVFVASRIQQAGFDPWRLGGELWGHVVDGRLEAMAYVGANLVTVEAGPDAVRAFADRARRQGRRCSSIVGPAHEVLPLWELLEPLWGPARDVRPDQPLMTLDEPPSVALDPLVRRARPDELDLVLPACVAMFTEEVGVSPLANDGGVPYRARVRELVVGGRSFVRIEDGRVVFKAEVGAATEHACQVQGVWVAPDRRGEGLSAPAMAAVAEACRRDIAPVVSLYVNAYNVAALAAYRRVGFATVGRFATVLF